ncbi:hypothetical protein K504DRAFT_490718 [Pleomassaria siparia CBS 279.74]|uniref:Uncharacterized protein n=1 Tax=Pleomassaria siparia CBS 279.74 TaxID=1314801 RepID=A0A6G1KDD1_9PLEO|nr:hypothetical protein K504DRAFT_490718 [Pleomassaria siparia CBS 279.74]
MDEGGVGEDEDEDKDKDKDKEAWHTQVVRRQGRRRDRQCRRYKLHRETTTASTWSSVKTILAKAPRGFSPSQFRTASIYNPAASATTTIVMSLASRRAMLLGAFLGYQLVWRVCLSSYGQRRPSTIVSRARKRIGRDLLDLYTIRSHDGRYS